MRVEVRHERRRIVKALRDLHAKWLRRADGIDPDWPATARACDTHAHDLLGGHAVTVVVTPRPCAECHKPSAYERAGSAGQREGAMRAVQALDEALAATRAGSDGGDVELAAVATLVRAAKDLLGHFHINDASCVHGELSDVSPDPNCGACRAERALMVAVETVEALDIVQKKKYKP